MANVKCFYLGPYLKVWPPEIDYESTMKTCTSTSCKNHGQYLRSNFCEICGSTIDTCKITGKTHLSLHDFLAHTCGDEDLFGVVRPDDEEFSYLISNSNLQGGDHIESFGDYPLPDPSIDQFGHNDWTIVCGFLDVKQIKYEKCCGVVFYYN